jgi:membrane associated rhomboid family serine protease
MPSCLKCGDALTINDEGVAPVLCDRCAGVATGRARRSMNMGVLYKSPATTVLLAINILVYILQQVPGLYVTFWGENIGPLTLSGQYWRLFTAGFLHADIFHIGMNMWCLWSLGRLSERLFGKWQTFLIYMLTGVGGAMLSIAYDHSRAELGASGAVFGIVGAVIAGVKFGDLDISSGERRAILSSAISFAVLNFVLSLPSVGMFANIDNMCHLGGFVTGLLLGLPLGAFSRNRVMQLATIVVTSIVLAAAGRELIQTNGPAAQKAVARIAYQNGNYIWASELLEKYIVSNPNDEEALLNLGNAYLATGHQDRAIVAFQLALKVDPASTDAKEALEELKAPTAPNQK